MRKTVLIILILIFVLGIASDGYCYGPIRKLGRGVSNLATFPFEVPYRIFEVGKRSGPYEGITYGLWSGACNMILRGVVGLYEIVTFPIPFPEGYEPMMNDPEFLWKKNSA